MAQVSTTLFYIVSGTNYFELDSTATVDITSNTSISKHPTLDGTITTDNAVIDQNVISFSGIVSNIKSAQKFWNARDGQDLDTPTEFIQGINNIRNNRQLVSVYVDNETFINCVITGFSYQRTVDVGRGWSVTLTFTQIQKGQALGRSEDLPAGLFATEDFKNQAEGRNDVGDKTTNETDTTAVQATIDFHLGSAGVEVDIESGG